MSASSRPSRAATVAVLERRGRFLVAEPFFERGPRLTLTRDRRADAGDLVLVKATPANYQEVARSHVLAGKCWNSASVSNGRIYARSTTEGVSLDVSLR